MIRFGLGVLVAAAVLTTGADAQTVQAGDLELDFTGRLQFQVNTTSLTDSDLGAGNAPPALELRTRRVRFGTNFAYGEWLSGKAEMELGGSGASLTDGYVDAELSDRLVVRMGQFKVPFGLIELESNTRVLTIERTVAIRGLDDLITPGEAQYLLDANGFVGRQVGVMVHGTANALGFAAGVFNGEGANARDTLESKAYAARVTYGFGESLVLGGAVSSRPTGIFDGVDEIRATAFAVDAEYGGFRSEGLHVMAEVMAGDNPLLLITNEPPSMLGGQVVAAWYTPRDGRVEGYEPLLRVSYGDPDTDVASNEGLTVTPGVNLYFSGRNRLMLNADTYVPMQDGLDPEYSLKAQFQIYF